MNALLALPDLQPERLFVQSGDVRLAVHCWGAPDNDKPTLLMVHGYPDNHETWLPLIRQLAGRYRIVAYDVRGAGASDKPRWSRDYHLQRLSEDLQAVIRATSPDRPVHLLAHDWGSIQTWESVTDPQCRPLIASYTSISGPCLDHVGFWMREHLRQRSPKALKAVFGQLLHSWYIAFFHTPVVPELLWSAGLARLWPQFLKHAEGVRHPQVNPTQASDGRHGVKLYRGNFIRSLFRPRKRHTEVPVQLIVPTRDRYVGAQLFQHLSLWAPRLWRREASVGHWQLLAEPEQLAGWLGEFIDAQETGESPPALQRAQVRPDARSMSGKLVVVTGAGGRPAMALRALGHAVSRALRPDFLRACHERIPPQAGPAQGPLRLQRYPPALGSRRSGSVPGDERPAHAPAFRRTVVLPPLQQGPAAG